MLKKITILISAIILLSVIVWFISDRYFTNTSEPLNSTKEGWVTYSPDKYNFLIKYPKYFTIQSNEYEDSIRGKRVATLESNPEGYIIDIYIANRSLNGYKIIDQPSGVNFEFNADLNEWIKNHPQPEEVEIYHYNNITYYLYSYGEFGKIDDAIISSPDNNYVITIVFSKHYDEYGNWVGPKEELEVKDIVNTLNFY
ncbi:MAG: hypothetical protein COU07_00510 [Candidatus Harrisonbacteria bacterium CG10_big_fil_rev_8_21_14_0_10_40_38]|uniref:PsbP C-terminal domain-containing protein n=1 Tax=Candidatus Harrisonbacteria bacterium CG10_big_fil_rev_8_21_14_0_10_40_38 TaxID=1974583 RepID=A0A2H0USK7_9BACT|nr:MAG: hypothetical protein COU07_00510 [Candidatus Harrisonbacteria bacterium CG10_big_fil_rev_8_21_14_0_10_40_38]